MNRKVKTVGSVKEFLNTSPVEEQKTFDKLVDHLDKYKVVYNVVGSTALFTLTGADFVFAADSAIDRGAKKFYDKIVEIGKWFIIVKGSIEIIKNVSNGDFDSAKKGGISYVLIYVILLALPWSFNEIEKVFEEMR